MFSLANTPPEAASGRLPPEGGASSSLAKPVLRWHLNRAMAVLASLAFGVSTAQVMAQAQFQNIGRAATPAEIKAWDIDVRPDLKGLPAGKGTAAKGEAVWEAKCASCHGTFGESNEVFTPLVGYTTKKDIETGRVRSLTLEHSAPTRTTLMKASQISSLWDYINRAMPWTAPKSLSPDEVYSVLAYMLNLGDIIPVDYELNERTMADVQKRLPNRNGMTTRHAMWPGKEFGGTSKPDVQGSACMKNCATDPKVASFIPDYARNAHGNLAEQSRVIGPMRGANTMAPERKEPLGSARSESNTALALANIAPSATKTIASSAPTVASAGAALKLADVNPLLQKYACAACHGVDNKIVGPSFKEIVAKQGKRADAQAYLSGKIRSGGQGVYGQIPMPAQSISAADADKIAQWLVQGAAR
jgi:S-disulfanyl-L-cysteine oxidoreductase SoxD